MSAPELRAIIADDTIECGDFTKINGIAVSPKKELEGFTADYFNTPIQGKHVFVPLEAYGGYLPTNLGKYEVRETAEDFEPEDDCYFYKEVAFESEPTIGDLYANAYKYAYVSELNKYMPLPEAGAKQNKIKFILSRDITTIAGDQFDRISDYGRLLLFLLKKAYPQMTTEEQAAFSPLMVHAPEAAALNDLIYRETKIQEKIQAAKADPDKFVEDYLNECPN